MNRKTSSARTALGGAALACALTLAPHPARGSDSIIGGRAQLCSEQARKNIHSAEAMENCTIAILTESLSGHMLAATYVNRATMEIASTNYGAAMRDVDEALRVEPALGAAYVNRGGALLGLGRFRDSETEIDKGLALNPEEPEKAYANRALARWHQDNVKGAWEDFMKASELKPNWDFPKEQLSHFTVTLVPKKP